MKTILIGLMAAAGVLAQQTFDMKLLDKLGANSTGSTNITLDANTLKLASSMLGNDKDHERAKSIVDKLKSVQVRTYEYDAPGKYNESDLEPLRVFLENQKWSRIVDVKEAEEKSQVYTMALPDGQLGGLAVLTMEPKEVTVVMIDGTLNLQDLGKLGGNLGIPDITLDHGGKGTNGKKDPQSKDK